jgi:hypothetical protein
MTALEKFIAKMNETSDFWTKPVEITAQHGHVTIVRCDGWTFKTDNITRETVKNA